LELAFNSFLPVLPQASSILTQITSLTLPTELPYDR